jgi:hypothetical protein
MKKPFQTVLRAGIAENSPENSRFQWIYAVSGILAALLAVAAFFALLHPWAVASGPLRINLRDFPLYVKAGFHHADISRDPRETVWDAVLPAGEQKPAIIKDVLPR